jgi:hypothetical protein
MDIQKQKSLRRFPVNRFALNAIAAAVLALHAEIASAASCPTEIVGTALAGVICDFNTGSSVTVENGGIVGGIKMNGFSPSPPSLIAINAGGEINTTTGIGIVIKSSILSKGLSNSGTINSTSATGISITSGSTISGGLSNSGLISTGALGVKILQSTINGDILNTGTIKSTTLGTGILISQSTVHGKISNSGTITGSGDDSGISVLRSTAISDGIINNGVINSDVGNSILVHSSCVIEGGITNNGTIKSIANDGLSVDNVSTVIGNITNSGTISGGNHGVSVHNASAVNGSIVNHGTISGGQTGLSVFSATTVSGGITNSGTISGGTTGVAIHTSTTINGGLSNSGTIQGGTNAIYVATDSNLNHIDILGQHARVIGAVNAVNTTINITNGALFTSEGTFNVNDFNIASNAKFNMANTITAANGVNNSGTLAVVDSLQTINGNYTQNTGGIFQVGVSSASNYGALAVTGVADLSASGNINVQLAQNASLHAGEVIPNIISGNTLLAPTNGYQVSDNSFIWKFTATPNVTNNGVNLVGSIDPVATTVCQGDYCRGAANVILGQVAAGNPAFGAYVTLPTASAFQAAASQATPEMTNENIQVTQAVTRSVMDVVPMWGSLHGQSAGDAMLSDPGKVWIKPYNASIIQDESHSIDGYNASAYGFVVGRDAPLTGNGMLGGAFALGKDDMHGKGLLSGQTIHGDLYQAILYAARKFPHNLYLAGQGLLGYGNNDTNRIIPIYANTATGSYNSWFANLRTQLGWNVYTANQNFVMTPMLDASYLYVNQGGYREAGSRSMDLLVNSNHNSSLVLGAYGNFAYHLASYDKLQYLTLTAYAGVARNMLNTEPRVTAAFVAGGPNFSTFGVQSNNPVFRGGIGLNVANPIKPLKVSINYDAQIGNSAYSGIGSATISYAL